MEKINWNLYVEQVNQNCDTNVVEDWQKDPEKALNNVVDPNTEFKLNFQEANEEQLSPSKSYNLTTMPQPTFKFEPKKLPDNRRCSNGYMFDFEDSIESDLQTHRTRSLSEASKIASVHVYTSSPLHTRNKLNCDIGESINMQENLRHQLDLSTEPAFHNKNTQYFNGTIENKETISYKVTEKDRASVVDSDVTNDLHSITSVDSDYMVNNDLDEKGKMSNMLLTPSHIAISDMLQNETTADQIAWAFRAARDRMETVSNFSGCSSRFEVDSNYSDKAETMSTISNVSGYEDEILRIRRLLLFENNGNTFKNFNIKEHEEIKFKNDIESKKHENVLSVPHVESTELVFHRLNTQLQTALSEKEKFRVEAVEARNKANLEWQGKYQEILRQKACTEGRLEAAQKEIETLQHEITVKLKQVEQEIKSRNISTGNVILKELEKQTLEYSKLQQLVHNYESKLQDLNLTLQFKNSEIDHLKNEFQELNVTNEKLRIELHELKVEIEAKEAAIDGLKNKIATQHVECQTLLQGKLKAENNLVSLKNELESVRKSNIWYRDQLNSCQSAKTIVQQELMACQANLLSKSQNEIKLTTEITRLEDACKEIQQRAVREKETMMRRLEVIQADMVEREAMIMSHIEQKNTSSETLESISTNLKKMEEDKQQQLQESDILIQEKIQQIELLKSEIKNSNYSLAKVESEKSQLMVRLASVQRTLNEKEIELQRIENDHKTMLMSYNQMKENLGSKEKLLHELKNDKVSLEVSLMSSESEKKDVNAAIEKLREDFSKVSANYQTMKDRLREKEKCISSLEDKIKNLEYEKLGCMSQIEDLMKFKSNYEDMQCKLIDVDQINWKNIQLSTELEETIENSKNMQTKITKLEEALAIREEQLINQAKSCEITQNELQQKENIILNLMKDKDELMCGLNKCTSDLKNTESSNQELQLELQSITKQLQQANTVIGQFNALCKSSEEEKHMLSVEFKKLQQTVAAAKNDVISSLNTESGENYITHPGEERVSDADNHSVSLQIKLNSIYNLVQENKQKIISLLPEKFKCDTVEKEIEINSDDHVCQVLVFSNKCLDEIIKYMNSLTHEIGNEKHRNKDLENILKKTQECVNNRPRDSYSHMDFFTQTDNKYYTTSMTQTCDKNAESKNELELEKLKTLLKLLEAEHKEKHRKYERNVRTLLKKVKEHIRGRKIAEKKLEELCLNLNVSQNVDLSSGNSGEVDILKADVRRLTAELETVQKECEEQRLINENTQETLLTLEKERGKLIESVSKDSINILQQTLCENDNVSQQLEQKAREMQLQQCHTRIAELEDQVHKLSIIVKDLKTEIFNERLESSQLRKQVSSLRMGLDNANDVIDNKNIELGRNKSMCELLTDMKARLQNELDMEQRSHEETKKQVANLIEALEHSKAKDPLLEDQIKTLSYHLHQKSQEVTNLEEKLKVLTDSWKTKENSLVSSMSTLQEELVELRSELESMRNDKFILQAQATELKSALHSSINNYKVLKMNFDVYCTNSGKDKLPDLALNLPSPPEKYDERKVVELLRQSSHIPRLKPLSNLQNCLDSLKSEMTTLQKQLEAKTVQSKSKIENNIQKLHVEEI